MPDMEPFYRAYKPFLIFRQHQGMMAQDVTVGKGVCSALTFEWIRQNLAGTYTVGNWTGVKDPMFRKFAVPVDSGIGKRFPHLTDVSIGMPKVQPGMALKQKLTDLAVNTLGIERNFELLAKSLRCRTPLLSKFKSRGETCESDLVEGLEKFNARFFGGYGLIGVDEPGGHAMACQIAGSLIRYYDPNFGEFKFQTVTQLYEVVMLTWMLGEYKFHNYYLWTVYPVG